MDDNENFKETLIEDEKIINSSSIDVDSKAAAWRRQGMILAEITRDSCQSIKRAMFQKHFDKNKDREEFLSRRAMSVDKLLKGFPVEKMQEFDYVKECQELDSSDLLLPQSNKDKKNNICHHDEVSEESLNELFANISKVKNSSTSEPNNDEQRTRDISSYFQRKKPPSVAQARTIENKCPVEVDTILAKSNFRSSEKATTDAETVGCSFRTAREELICQNLKKYGDGNSGGAKPLFSYGATKKSLGARRTVRSGFLPPVRPENPSGYELIQRSTDSSTGTSPHCTPPDAEPVDERLLNIDPKMVELITNEIMHKYKPIEWSDIAGLEYAKSTIKEAVVWPLLRPDIFTGLRRPPRGILLFGPPGTGKTLIGKCIASQSKSTFFSISASSLTSKWIGDGEKMVRALFAVAAVRQPSVVFIDEIDSLLSQRSETEHESSRRLKTEFLVQLDGAATSDDDRILIVGATNRPQELDEAARRRLVRRLYIPLPELEARIQILTNLLKMVNNSIGEREIHEIGTLTDGYSGADMEMLCREASMEPIRSIPPDEIPFFNEDKVRPVNVDDFRSALERVRASVSPQDLQQYIEWNRVYGAGQ